MIDKALLRRRLRQVYKALADLADLHVWPGGQDIADVERKLLEELNEIEYELGRDFRQEGTL